MYGWFNCTFTVNLVGYVFQKIFFCSPPLYITILNQHTFKIAVKNFLFVFQNVCLSFHNVLGKKLVRFMNVYYCVTKRMTVTQDAKVSAQTFLLNLKTSVKVDYSIKDICLVSVDKTISTANHCKPKVYNIVLIY